MKLVRASSETGCSIVMPRRTCQSLSLPAFYNNRPASQCHCWSPTGDASGRLKAHHTGPCKHFPKMSSQVLQQQSAAVFCAHPKTGQSHLQTTKCGAYQHAVRSSGGRHKSQTRLRSQMTTNGRHSQVLPQVNSIHSQKQPNTQQQHKTVSQVPPKRPCCHVHVWTPKKRGLAVLMRHGCMPMHTELPLVHKKVHATQVL